MRKIDTVLVITGLFALQAAACSSSSSRVTSLDSDKTFSSLTAEERRQYCEDQFHYMSTRVDRNDRRKADCATAAAAVGQGTVDTARARAACQQTYRACLSVPAAEPQMSCEAFPANAEGCTATVGEASACAEARGDALATLASRADAACDGVGRTSASERQRDQPSKNEACARVQTLCPKLFGEPVSRSGTP